MKPSVYFTVGASLHPDKPRAISHVWPVAPTPVTARLKGIRAKAMSSRSAGTSPGHPSLLELPGQGEGKTVSLSAVINFKEMPPCEITTGRQDRGNRPRRRLQSVALEKPVSSQQACLRQPAQRQSPSPRHPLRPIPFSSCSLSSPDGPILQMEKRRASQL